VVDHHAHGGHGDPIEILFLFQDNFSLLLPELPKNPIVFF
jgi:hypothetical protein